MRSRTRRRWAAALLGAALTAPLVAAQASEHGPEAAGPAARLAAALQDPLLARLVAEVLERNPELAAVRARAEAAGQRAPQVRALPDPALGLTAFVAPPETRVGPARAMLTLSQAVPWLGKLRLEERAAVLTAAALEAEVESTRLRLVTEARRLYLELAFLRRYEQITERFRQHLLQHEEIARTRYATGVGLGQGVVKLQAEITRTEAQLLELRQSQIAQAARLAALRDRPAGGEVPVAELAPPAAVQVERDPLETAALRRPELAAAAAELEAAEARRQLAERQRRPDFSVGLTFTAVEPRQDEPGRLQPPPGNGDDDFGLFGSVTLPVRRGRIAAGIAEAELARTAADEARRAVEAEIRGEIDELAGRLPLAWQQLRLAEDVLVLQAEESLDSARAGYIAGTLNALDLLDAEHVLFAARPAVARAAADYAIYLARLEGAVASPLPLVAAAQEPMP